MAWNKLALHSPNLIHMMVKSNKMKFREIKETNIIIIISKKRKGKNIKMKIKNKKRKK